MGSGREMKVAIDGHIEAKGQGKSRNFKYYRKNSNNCNMKLHENKVILT